MHSRRLPRIELVREVTDRAILDVLVENGPMARAEISRRTGISKPTVTVAVNRLEAARLIEVEEGKSRTGRGSAGAYGISAAAGFVGAVSVNPEGLMLRMVDLLGRPLLERKIATDVDDPGSRLRPLVADALRSLNRRRRKTGRLRSLVVSVANPVDESQARLIQLPDLPHAEESFDPVRQLRGVVDAPVLVDNDVNLAAVAERQTGVAVGQRDFVFVYVGVGLGAALVLNGELIRGARGLAGELGYAAVTGQSAHPRTHSLAAALADAGLGEPGGYRLDVNRARVVLSNSTSVRGRQSALEQTSRLLGGAVTSLCAFVDPSLVVLSGPIGSLPGVIEGVGQVVAQLAPAPVPVLASALHPHSSLDGAVTLALHRARADLLGSSP